MSGINRIKIFKDTIQQCETDPRLVGAVKDSIAGTQLYTPDEYPEISRERSLTGKVTVTKERTFEAAASLLKEHPKGRAAVLNFASATNPGGGVALGASAQEECLCRCSTLYPCLTADELKKGYYSPHRKAMNVIYTDACIYTPDVFVIKTDTAEPEPMPIENWYRTDVLTCAAPNLSTWHMSRDKQLETHLSRGRHIMTIAAANGADLLVLGAFGCGAFRNDPETVAKAYKKLTEEFKGYFHEIRFAVYCGAFSKNYDIFSKILL